MSLSQPLIPAPPRVASWFILIAVLLDMAGFGVSIAVLPSLIGSMAGGKAAGLINGAFVGVWALIQFIAAPVLGALSDRFGRRPLILISMAGLGLDYIVMALAPNLWWLLAGRIVSALTSSSFSICYAYMADVTPEERRAAAFGRLGAVFGLGFILGPAVGGMLGGLSLRAPFWAAAGFSLLNAVFGYLVLPESLSKDRRSPFAWAKANPLGSLRLLRSHADLAGLSLAHLMTQFAGASIASVYVLYVMRRFGWSLTAVGLSLAFVGVVVALMQGLVQGRVTGCLGERRTLLLAAAAGALSLVMFATTPVGWGMLVGIAVFGVWGLQGPALMALMSRRVSETEQGQLQGAVGSLTSLADGIGPVVFGGVYSLTAGTLPGAAFLLASVVVAVSLLLIPGSQARP
jgi:DHA1 family tetracycline resistance protein-like MFS transporter